MASTSLGGSLTIKQGTYGPVFLLCERKVWLLRFTTGDSAIRNESGREGALKGRSLPTSMVIK